MLGKVTSFIPYIYFLLINDQLKKCHYKGTRGEKQFLEGCLIVATLFFFLETYHHWKLFLLRCEAARRNICNSFLVPLVGQLQSPLDQLSFDNLESWGRE